MSDIDEAYRTLGLKSDASFKEVMEAHRDLAVVWDPRPHRNNPRLHRKATENLARVNNAFQLIRSHHLGTEIEMDEVLEEPVEQVEAEPEGQESSLYQEIFSDREAEARKRMPIGKIVVAALALMMVLTYWSASVEEERSAAQQTPQGREPLLEVEIKDGSLAPAGASDEAVEGTAKVTPPTDSSGPLVVPRLKKESASPPVAQSPPPVDPPQREAPVVERTTREPEKKPVLQRNPPAANPEPQSPTPEEVREQELSQEAFELLKDKSVVARKLIEGGLQDRLSYQEWRMVRAREPEFWIDLIAQRSADGGELHFIWSVNTETGAVTPMSQAARDLNAELSSQP